MKNLLLVWFASLSLIVSSRDRQFTVGAEGGPGLGILFGNEIVNKAKPNANISGAAGFIFQYNFPKIVSIRTGLLYERKGMRRVGPLNTTDYNGNIINEGKLKTNFNIDYLAIPVLARVTFGKKLQFFVDAGVYFGFMLKTRIIYNNTNPNFPPRWVSDQTSNTKIFDFGISAGPGLRLPVKDRFAVSFEIRNNIGLLNISKLPISNDKTLQTFNTLFLFGFEYSFGKKD